MSNDRTVQPERLCDLESDALDGSPESAAYERALNFLSYRPRSTNEVRQRLRQKALDDSIIDRVVSRLTERGLLDDTEFSRFWVENRERFSPRSDRALRFELRGKGIDGDTIAGALLGLGEESDRALTAGRRRLSRFAQIDDDLFLPKMTNYLVRLGFNYRDAREASTALARERKE